MIAIMNNAGQEAAGQAVCPVCRVTFEHPMPSLGEGHFAVMILFCSGACFTKQVMGIDLPKGTQ